jgi:hypothetical protein
MIIIIILELASWPFSTMPRHERSHLPKKLINPRLPIWLQAILRDHLRLLKSTSDCNKPLPRPISNNKGNMAGSTFPLPVESRSAQSKNSCNSNGHHTAIDKPVNPCVRAVHRSKYRQWILRGRCTRASGKAGKWKGTTVAVKVF